MIFPVHHLTELILLVFLALVFLQSSLDKLMDWKNNIAWLKNHFSKTCFKNRVPFLLAVVLLVELGAGILCVGGIGESLADRPGPLALLGAVASAIALLMLLVGQRVAKDYDGARTLVIYLIPTVFLVFLLEM